MFRNTFGQTFTARNLMMASLFQVNLNDLMGLRYFNALPRTQLKGRQAVARSRYTPAGPSRNTPAAINSRRIRAAGGLG